MPNIIGIPAGKMICTGSNQSTDMYGLTRLSETYAFLTSEESAFRGIFKNMTPHSTIMNYVYPTPTVFYPVATIESADISTQPGGISTATINYVGVLVSTSSAKSSGIYNTSDTSWLPPSIEKLQSNNSLYNAVDVIVTFLYYSPKNNSDSEVASLYGIGTPKPRVINGRPIYQSNKEPTTDEGFKTPFAPLYRYYGMACITSFIQKVGLYYLITNTYADCYIKYDFTVGQYGLYNIVPKGNVGIYYQFLYPR